MQASFKAPQMPQIRLPIGKWRTFAIGSGGNRKKT
jgi:hypothetical protein